MSADYYLSQLRVHSRFVAQLQPGAAEDAIGC